MSRFWNNNVELLDKITIECLPEEWKEKVESGEIELYDVPNDIVSEAMLEGERDFWATQIDAVKTRRKYEKD